VFSYDAWGNLLTIGGATGYTGCSQESLSVSAANNNQVSGYGYDAAGNMTSVPGIATYTYNAENQLVTTAGVTYAYDGDGKRVSKSTGKLYWFGMGSDPITESDASGNITNEYVFFGGKRIAKRDSSGNVDYYFADHLGTARVVTNSAGTVLDDSDFYPFGGERAYSSGSGNNYKFTSKERDSESGLDNFGARYMSSSMGRFVSADPITVTPGRVVDPQQLNLYSYVRNNPLRLVDPTGMLLDDSQLSDKDKKKWQKIQDLANKKDKEGNYVNKKLHDVFDRLQSDKRTFVLENSKLGAGTAGKFTITEMSGNDFTKATLQLDFKQISSISSTTPADQVPGFNKYEGIVGNKTLELAETFGHEGAHGVFALDNTAEEVGLQGLLNQQDAALKSGNFPLPPDVMQKINDGLAKTEKYAQQTEKIINGELQAKENKKP